MKTMAALLIVGESLEETTLKMMKEDREECLKDIKTSTDKYMKLALKLKNKAYLHIEENMDEVISFYEFLLKKESK